MRDVHNLGSGDSEYVVCFLKNPEEVFVNVVKEVVEFIPREELPFSIFGKRMLLRRDKQFFGDVEEDGSYPLVCVGSMKSQKWC